MTTYRGYTDLDETSGGPNGPVLVYADGRAPYRLRHLIVHSPSGMAWGYGYCGSGAADLALALLADHLGEADAIPPHDRYSPALAERIGQTVAWRLHHAFMTDCIACFAEGQGWTLTSEDIAAWLAPRRPEIEQEHQERRALALVGHRVQLDDGRTGDVMDINGAGEALRLVVIIPGVDAWQRIAPAHVARDLGEMPDDEEEE